MVHYQVDFLAQFPADAILSGASAAIEVYSGTETSTAGMVGAVTYSGTVATIPVSGGVAGAIYLLTVTGVTAADGTATMSGFIAILP